MATFCGKDHKTYIWNMLKMFLLKVTSMVAITLEHLLDSCRNTLHNVLSDGLKA